MGTYEKKQIKKMDLLIVFIKSVVTDIHSNLLTYM
jgi:hypothetical protein